MNSTDEFWLLCERKYPLSWTQDYICLLSSDALYLRKKPRKMKISWEGKHAVLNVDKGTFLNDPKLKVYCRDTVEEYRFFISYDERETDITPIDEVEKYATISFRDKISRKKIVLRCAQKIEEIRKAANKIFEG